MDVTHVGLGLVRLDLPSQDQMQMFVKTLGVCTQLLCILQITQACAIAPPTEGKKSNMWKAQSSWSLFSHNIDSENKWRMSTNAGTPLPWASVGTHSACAVFTMDGDPSNKKNFKAETDMVATKARSREPLSVVNVCLPLYCYIHSMCLSRKDVVLAQKDLWTTVVRFAHLWRSKSFRVDFSLHLNKIVKSSFRRVAVPTLPDIATKTARSALAPYGPDLILPEITNILIEYDNGDITSEKIIFYDVNGQRNDQDRDALIERKICEAFQLFFLGRSVSIPLLYRWKHGPRTLVLMIVGKMFHNLLSRVLGSMLQKAKKGPALPAQVDELDNDDAGRGGDQGACSIRVYVMIVPCG